MRFTTRCSCTSPNRMRLVRTSAAARTQRQKRQDRSHLSSNVRVRFRLLAWRSQHAEPRPQPVLPPRIGKQYRQAVRVDCASGARLGAEGGGIRASEACNFVHMIVPVERDWVLKVVVSAVGLDAAQTAGTHRVGLRIRL